MVDKIVTSLQQETLNRFIQFEGKVPHFYLDGPGFVTIGIGCMLPTVDYAIKLNLYHKIHIRKATLSEMIDDYNKIKRSTPRKSMAYYGRRTKLYLPDEDIIRLFEVRLDEKISSLKFHFLEYDKFPDAVRDVLMDMAYNLGISGLLNKFPKFCEHIKRQQWKAAANESHRNGIQESRNIWAFETLNNI